MYISFEDFSRLKLRIGKVKQARAHPNADKLYILRVELAEREIQLVAGIRATYSPEELLGKQIVVLENLEPKVIRGVASEGMLLAASDKEGPVLLVPEKEVTLGCEVK